MHITHTQYADVAVLGAVGRLDHNTAAGFRESIGPYLKPDYEILLFDFSGVEYISSAGLRELLIASKQRKAENCIMVVSEASAVVQEVFEISRFNLVIDLFPSVINALSALSPAALAAYQAQQDS